MGADILDLMIYTSEGRMSPRTTDMFSVCEVIKVTTAFYRIISYSEVKVCIIPVRDECFK